MSIYKTILGMLKANNYRLFFLYMLLVSIGSIGFAFFVEFVLGFEPCFMCLYQRIPYYALSFAAIGGLVIKNTRLFLYSILLITISSTFLAGYHTGIERGIFNPTDKCSSGDFISKDLTHEELLEKLYSAPLADCSKPAFKIFSISMTEWNLILSFCLVIITAIMLSRRSK